MEALTPALPNGWLNTMVAWAVVYAIVIIGVGLAATHRKGYAIPAPAPDPSRLKLAIIVAALTALSLFGSLGAVWYGGSAPFHWFDDSHQWLQMDKLGHAYTAYHESLTMFYFLRWAGLSREHARWGLITGFIMQSPIEILDGFEKKWGASVTDLIANGAGSSLAAANDCIYGRQAVMLKFSFFPSVYAAMRPGLFGSGLSAVVKDYNGQTYWLSFNIRSFLPEHWQFVAPRWLNVAVGLGAGGLLGGYGKEPEARIAAREFRRYYLGLDIDLMQLGDSLGVQPGKLRIALFALNYIRLPLPALEFNEHDGFRFHALKF